MERTSSARGAKSDVEVHQEVLVELHTGTWVIEGGVEHRRWRVELNGVWMPVERVPSARVERADDDEPNVDADPERGTWLVRPPGCQYLCRCQIRLPLGTKLELQITRPRDRRATKGDPILSWYQHTQPRRTTVSRCYRVGRQGRLLDEKMWQKARERLFARR